MASLVSLLADVGDCTHVQQCLPRLLRARVFHFQSVVSSRVVGVPSRLPGSCPAPGCASASLSVTSPAAGLLSTVESEPTESLLGATPRDTTPREVPRTSEFPSGQLELERQESRKSGRQVQPISLGSGDDQNSEALGHEVQMRGPASRGAHLGTDTMRVSFGRHRDCWVRNGFLACAVGLWSLWFYGSWYGGLRRSCVASGHRASTWHMLVADDFHLKTCGQAYRPALIVFFALCATCGVPLPECFFYFLFFYSAPGCSARWLLGVGGGDYYATTVWSSFVPLFSLETGVESPLPRRVSS